MSFGTEKSLKVMRNTGRTTQMLTIEIATNDDKILKITHADAFWYDSEDETYRVTNDLNDMVISMPESIEDVEIDDDMVFIPLSIVKLITVK